MMIVSVGALLTTVSETTTWAFNDADARMKPKMNVKSR